MIQKLPLLTTLYASSIPSEFGIALSRFKLFTLCPWVRVRIYRRSVFRFRIRPAIPGHGKRPSGKLRLELNRPIVIKNLSISCIEIG